MNMLRCPICGGELNPLYLKSLAEKRITIIDGNEVAQSKCNICGEFIIPIELKHNLQYYSEKSKELYGTPWKDSFIILEEIKEYGLLDMKKYEMYQGKLSEQALAYIDKKNENKTSQNIPKCPTCGSSNIENISALSRATHAYAFGLFSKTAKSQFKCKNCGYKW